MSDHKELKAGIALICSVWANVALVATRVVWLPSSKMLSIGVGLCAVALLFAWGATLD